MEIFTLDPGFFFSPHRPKGDIPSRQKATLKFSLQYSHPHHSSGAYFIGVIVLWL